MDLTEFRKLALELVHSSYTFTGRETLDSLDLVQLDMLRKHRWKRRKTQHLEDGEEVNNAQHVMDAKTQSFGVKLTNERASPVVDEEDEDDKPMYRETKAQKKKLVSIGFGLQTICYRWLPAEGEFYQRAKALVDKDSNVSADVVAFSLELKSKLQNKVFVDVDSDDASEGVGFQEFYAMFAGQGADRTELRATFDRLDVNKEGTIQQSQLSLYLLDANLPPDNSESGTISRGASIKKMPARRRRANMDVMHDALRDAEEIYGALVEVESLQIALREICLENVLDIAFKLQKEGVVAAPPLVSSVVPIGGCWSLLR